MYKITATAIKPGNPPVQWTRYSNRELSRAECEKLLTGRHTAAKEYGPSEGAVTLRDFRCEPEA